MTTPAEIVIRRAAPGEEQALALLGQATFLESFVDFIPGADLVTHCRDQHAPEKYAGWLVDPASAVWVAESAPGSAPLGYLVLTRPDLPLPDVTAADAEIKRVYVLHRFQGRRIGARLMAEAEREARGRRCRRLLLGVNAQNRPAISFYRGIGYERVGTRTFQVGGQRYDDLILGKPLV